MALFVFVGVPIVTSVIPIIVTCLATICVIIIKKVKSGISAPTSNRNQSQNSENREIGSLEWPTIEKNCTKLKIMMLTMSQNESKEQQDHSLGVLEFHNN